MVWPDMLLTISPGLVAVLLGMFSTAGTTTLTLIGSFISAMAAIVPSTLAAPHMSYFISSMAGPGLSESRDPIPSRFISVSFRTLVVNLPLPAASFFATRAR